MNGAHSVLAPESPQLRRLRDLAALLLAAAAACGAPGEPARDEAARAPAAPPASTRLLVIGLDAADWDAIDPLIRAGKLPRLAGLRSAGASGPLHSHLPMLSPILWTTIATGLSPERHRVLDFTESDGRGGARPIGTAARRAPAIWDLLGDASWKVGVVGWLATWPAPRVSGWLVSDRLTIHPFESLAAAPAPSPAGKTWPAELYEEVMPRATAPEALTAFDLEGAFGVSPADPAAEALAADERALCVVLAATRTHRDAAVEILRSHRPDLMAVYFDGIDRLSHLFADVAETPLAGADPRRAARYGQVIPRFYEIIDGAVGAVVDAAGPGATVLIVSDHGWRSGVLRPRTDPRRDGPFAAEWHRDTGVFLASGRGVRAGVTGVPADLYDIAPTVLAIAGLAPSIGMRGRVLTGIFEPGFLPPAAAPVARPDLPPAAPAPADGSGADAEARAGLEALQGLGYVAAAPADARAGGGVTDRSQANLGAVYLDEGRFEEAAAAFKAFLSAHPEDYDSRYNLAAALRRLDRPAEAEREFTKAAKTRPRSAEPLVALGELAFNTGDDGRARTLAEKAVALDGGSAAARNLAGVVACRQNRVTECIEQLERAVTLDPRSPSAWLNLARALEGAGRTEEARQALQRGAEALPDEPRIRERLQGAAKSAS